jgi:RNA polymerase sigma-70 factor (ECF subfamily)
MDDKTAIIRCQEGDKDVFQHLVEHYQKEAIGHAIAILGNKEDSLDVVQEAFMDAFKAIKKFDCERRFYPWFYTILRHRCLKLLERKKRQSSNQLNETEIIAQTSDYPAEDAEHLEMTLLEIPPEDRELITLKYLDGLSYSDIAERLGVPEGTVMSRLYYARRRLWERLAGHPYWQKRIGERR